MDRDQSGTLDKAEFQEVMMVLFGNVLFRVLAQYSMTLMIVPFVAQAMLDGIYRGIELFYIFLTTLDEHSTLMNTIEVYLESTWSDLLTRIEGHTPLMVQFMAQKVYNLLQAVPSSVWNTLPLTLLSTVLGLAVVPWSLMKIDDYFQSLADRKAAKGKKQK